MRIVSTTVLSVRKRIIDTLRHQWLIIHIQHRLCGTLVLSLASLLIGLLILIIRYSLAYLRLANVEKKKHYK
jgi:hypothetical protein